MKPYSYLITADHIAGGNNKFWAACGTDSLYAQIGTEDGKDLLKRMQDKGTCRYLRNHHTLSSLMKDGFPDAGGDVYSEDTDGNPVYQFEKINDVFRTYLEYGIKPIVELDFMPDQLSRKVAGGGEEEGIYLNRSYPNDWNKWHRLLKAFVKNLADTFGTEEIRAWYFEVWNEPDGWPVEDWPQFHRMYDIFADAVLSVDRQLKIGGPGSFKQDFLHDFLEHVCNGINWITGERGTRIDFISHHIYGMSGSWLDEYPLVMPSVQRFNQEILWLSRLIGSYPQLEGAEFHLNEWGVCSHYEKKAGDYPALEIRNSEFSACFFVKLTDCIRQIGRQFGFEVSLMLYWGFCLEAVRGECFAGNRDLMTVSCIPKPIQMSFEMMGMMGSHLLQTEGRNAGGPVGCMAAGEGNEMQLLLYHFDETEQYEETAEGEIKIAGLMDGTYRIRRMLLDREHHNTYRMWQKYGSPERPEGDVLKKIKAAGEFSWDGEDSVEVQGGMLEIKQALPVQSIIFFSIGKTEEL